MPIIGKRVNSFSSIDQQMLHAPMMDLLRTPEFFVRIRLSDPRESGNPVL